MTIGHNEDFGEDGHDHHDFHCNDIMICITLWYSHHDNGAEEEKASLIFFLLALSAPSHCVYPEIDYDDNY